MTNRLIAQGHQEETGNQLESGPHADAMQRRAHRVRGGVGGAGHRSIGAAVTHHQVPVVQRIAQRRTRFIEGHALGATGFVKQ